MDDWDTVLLLENACLQVDGSTLFSHLSMELKAGEIVLLAGKSGVGKSSLMHVINGCYPNEDAAVTCDRLEVTGHDLRGKSLCERTAYVRSVFQNARLSFAMTTPYEEMIFCLENACFPIGQMEEKVAAQAERYGITPLLHREFATLSGGELQKVAFACADLTDAPLYLLDEPFANIDEAGIPYFMERIKAWARQGKTVCVIDHRLDFWDWADRWYLLEESGSLQVISLPLTEKQSEILRENGLIGEFPSKSPYHPQETVLQFQDVSIFVSGEEPLVQDIGFDLHAGEMTALIGRSGAGKTSLFKAILKQCRFRGGIELMGQSLARMKTKDLYSNVGLVFQDPSLQFMSAKVIDELRTSFPDLSESAMEELLAAFHFDTVRHVSPWLISQGQQRRLASLLMTGGDKAILLVDEPTYGQDFQSALAIMESLADLCRKGTACIFTSHDLRFVKQFAHQVLRIQDGRMEVIRDA
ncbi:energy-coupling factor transporter ATPase [Selenomonas sp. TAMA-11512]|uniref:ABC transporter ATP-binding protein n=1 Tax=Selenomonas sp. TAMA-11512 TaxID=3095337 RepID=UPI00308B3338|nr:energy-coupling factor transporter ATPase [Selenomonas sp. TAMA-11512]